MQQLGEVKSYIFNNKIILAIDERWIDYFNTDNPTFKAVIENGKYVLIGPKVSTKDPTTDNNHTSNEVDNSG